MAMKKVNISADLLQDMQLALANELAKRIMAELARLDTPTRNQIESHLNEILRIMSVGEEGVQ